MESKGFKEARSKLASIEADVIKNFINIGTHAKSLDGKERLRVLHEYFNQDTMEPFRFSFKALAESGKSVKDYIAPPGFDFRYPSRFKSGKMYGRLVKTFPAVYKLTGQMEHDKTCSMPKSHISYRKPRNISEEQREQARKQMIKQNNKR